jgi:hypothetical protein
VGEGEGEKLEVGKREGEKAEGDKLEVGKREGEKRERS